MDIKQEHYFRGIPEDFQIKGAEFYERSIRSFERQNKIKKELEKQWAACPERKEVYLLSAYYSVICCLLQDWSSSQTLDRVVFGALMQDVGLGEQIDAAGLIWEAMSEMQQKTFKQHCKMGVFILDQLDFENEAVKQIIFQHHENYDGTGTPNGLSSQKIFGLARIVRFSTDIAELVCSRKMFIIDALKFLLIEKQQALKYEPELVRLFLNMISKKGKKAGGH